MELKKFKTPSFIVGLLASVMLACSLGVDVTPVVVSNLAIGVILSGAVISAIVEIEISKARLGYYYIAFTFLIYVLWFIVACMHLEDHGLVYSWTHILLSLGSGVVGILSGMVLNNNGQGQSSLGARIYMAAYVLIQLAFFLIGTGATSL